LGTALITVHKDSSQQGASLRKAAFSGGIRFNQSWLASINHGWLQSIMAGFNQSWLASINHGWLQSIMAGFNQ
jgi:hypothetical protein